MAPGPAPSDVAGLLALAAVCAHQLSEISWLGYASGRFCSFVCHGAVMTRSQAQSDVASLLALAAFRAVALKSLLVHQLFGVR